MDLRKWDARFLALTEDVASWSKDSKTQVGCTIVHSNRRHWASGYNGYPAGIDDDCDSLRRDTDTIHSEVNALANLTFSPEGATVYVTKFPCRPCATSLIANRVARIVAPEPDSSSRWLESQTQALELLQKAKVEITIWTK